MIDIAHMTLPLAAWGWGPIWDIVRKPDNLPILLMMGTVGFFTWWSFSMALENDRLKATTGNPKADIFYPESEKSFPIRIHVWPWLLRTEFLCAIFVMAFLMAWSLGLMAPLEDPANPNLTPNPSKAPWYFLGLQEMLVYFDPWIAGVVMPTLIIVGLMAIPYIDVNPKGNGYYTWSERKFAISTFLFGFLALWVVMIVIGTFIRGPGWIWFWPGQEWDPHAVVSQTNRDLPDVFFGIPTKDNMGHLVPMHVVVGALAIVVFFAAAMGIPYLIMKKRNSPILAQLGLPRYLVTSFLAASMLSLVAKIFVRLAFTVKYVLVTPYARF
ncbi:MAG TPA: cytochrome C [Planctomycetota bacterium]|nr:cytochrome C [Planctomycetota bacterium]